MPTGACRRRADGSPHVPPSILAASSLAPASLRLPARRRPRGDAAAVDRPRRAHDRRPGASASATSPSATRTRSGPPSASASAGRTSSSRAAAAPGARRNLGVNGFTSRDVIEVELPQLDALRPELVTLLIGVNDVVQGVPADDVPAATSSAILDDAGRRVGAERVLVVTTPDYTVTPTGADYGDPVQQSAGIRANNAIITRARAAARGITVVDIHDISLEAATDRALVAARRPPPERRPVRPLGRADPAERDDAVGG